MDAGRQAYMDVLVACPGRTLREQGAISTGAPIFDRGKTPTGLVSKRRVDAWLPESSYSFDGPEGRYSSNGISRRRRHPSRTCSHHSSTDCY